MVARSYKTATEVCGWFRRCGFKTNNEAADALGISWRVWYRWKSIGIPDSLGPLISQLMERIEDERSKLTTEGTEK